MGKGSRQSPNVSVASFTQLVGAGGQKIVAMPGGVGSNPDGLPTKYGTEILRARAVALTRDMVAEVVPTGGLRKITGVDQPGT